MSAPSPVHGSSSAPRFVNYVSESDQSSLSISAHTCDELFGPNTISSFPFWPMIALEDTRIRPGAGSVFSVGVSSAFGMFVAVVPELPDPELAPAVFVAAGLTSSSESPPPQPAPTSNAIVATISKSA